MSTEPIKNDKDNWHTFDSGKSIGQYGSESGKIVKDIEHSSGARITIEKDGDVAPYSLTLGVYGLLMHTHFTGTEKEATQFMNLTKGRIEKLFEHLSIPETEQNDKWNEVFNEMNKQICEQD